MAMKIICPNCKHILGDTCHSMDADINCRFCKQPVHIKIKYVTTADYLPEENTNGNQSK